MIQTQTPYANAVVSSNPEALDDIHSDDKNIAIYQRDISTLSHELEQIGDQPISFQTSGKPAEILTALQDYFDQSLPNNPLLFKDMSHLLELFQKITNAPSFKLRIASINTDMCRRFHTDINDLRLLCTYFGPGTLWLPDEAVDQEALAKGDHRQEIIVEERHIQQVPTGDVVMLKGALHTQSNPILHRSPPVEAFGTTRFMLRIDTNQFLNF